jgi:hypothetical protein
VGHDRLAPRPRPRTVEEQGHRGAQARRLGDVGQDGNIPCAVLREAHERQAEETTDALEDGPERFYGSYLD